MDFEMALLRFIAEAGDGIGDDVILEALDHATTLISERQDRATSAPAGLQAQPHPRT